MHCDVALVLMCSIEIAETSLKVGLYDFSSLEFPTKSATDTALIYAQKDSCDHTTVQVNLLY